MIGVSGTRPFLASFQVLSHMSTVGQRLIIARCSGLYSEPRWLEKSGQLLQGAQELGGGRPRLQRSHLVDELLVEGGLIQELEEGPFRVGVRQDDVGLDDLSVFELDARGPAAVRQDAPSPPRPS